MNKMLFKKRRATIVLFVFLFVMLIPLVDSKVYRTHTDVDLRVVPHVNGSINSITANITVYNPKNQVVVSFEEMTKNLPEGDFNFTVNSEHINQTGIYTYTVYAYSTSAEDTATSFDFQVTPNGENGLLGFYFLVIILSYGVLSLGIFKRDITVSVLGTFALYFVGIWILFNGIDIFKNFLTDGFAVITLGVAFYVSGRMSYEYLFT